MWSSWPRTTADGKHPQWYYNLIAHPDCELGDEAFRAEEVTDPDAYARLFALAERYFALFADYRDEDRASGTEDPGVPAHAARRLSRRDDAQLPAVTSRREQRNDDGRDADDGGHHDDRTS